LFVFGHIGITLGAAVAGSGVYQVLQERFHKLDQVPPAPSADHPSPRLEKSPFSVTVWIERLGRFIDIRLLIIGSMLPDIIDKPVGVFFFKSTFDNGRIVSHTLVFLLVLLIPGLFLYWQRRKSWLLALAFGTLAHLILDQMWQSPQTLLWPLYGWEFPRFYEPDIIGLWVSMLKSNPEVYIPEFLGAAIILVFGVWVVSRRRLRVFLRKGVV
jgi:inner membrane protein